MEEGGSRPTGRRSTLLQNRELQVRVPRARHARSGRRRRLTSCAHHPTANQKARPSPARPASPWSRREHSRVAPRPYRRGRARTLAIELHAGADDGSVGPAPARVLRPGRLRPSRLGTPLRRRRRARRAELGRGTRLGAGGHRADCVTLAPADSVPQGLSQRGGRESSLIPPPTSKQRGFLCAFTRRPDGADRSAGRGRIRRLSENEKAPFSGLSLGGRNLSVRKPSSLRRQSAEARVRQTRGRNILDMVGLRSRTALVTRVRRNLVTAMNACPCVWGAQTRFTRRRGIRG